MFNPKLSNKPYPCEINLDFLFPHTEQLDFIIILPLSFTIFELVLPLSFYRLNNRFSGDAFYSCFIIKIIHLIKVFGLKEF